MTSRLARTAVRPLKALFVSDAFEGVLLMAVAVAAVAVANSPLSLPYFHLLNGRLPWTPTPFLVTARAWINEAVMAMFFFVVGLEVKRELVAGHLKEPAAGRLPIVAALAGMAAPAVLYCGIVGRAPGLLRGWAIPTATDIAFAMGVVGLLGQRVPAPLRAFLLTVAIVDDIGAVLVIALFYTRFVDVDWLNGALAVLAVLVAFNRAGVRSGWLYLVGAGLLWWCVLHAGVHPTVAGVVAAVTVPCRGPDSPLERLEHALVKWNAYLVVPLFALANAGVFLGAMGPRAALAPLPLAVAAGLILGKQAGIFGSVYLADRSGFAPRPEAGWGQIYGVALLCGIGFTMSLFIGGLAFPLQPAEVEAAKLGVLAGSLVSAFLGYVVLRAASRRPS